MSANKYLAMVDRGRARGLATAVHAMDHDAMPLCEYLGEYLHGTVRVDPNVDGVTCQDCRHLLAVCFDPEAGTEEQLQQCCPSAQAAAARLCGCGGQPYL